MTFTTRPGARANAKLLVGFHSESGAGKTFSSLLVARGFVGKTGRIVMIETESGRGEAYSDATEYPDIGGYDIISMTDNFSPAEYGEAITTAEKGDYGAVIIDSASHEWEGIGGVLDMADAADRAGKKGVLKWQAAKMEHQRRFMLRFMQAKTPLFILCMRSYYPMVETPKPGGGKEWRRSDQLHPKQSSDILFEMFLHGWISPQDHAFNLTKCTSKALESVFRRQPITLETGQELAEWARGGKTAEAKEAAKPDSEVTLKSAMEWLDKMKERLSGIDTPADLQAFMDKSRPNVARMRDLYPDVAQSCVNAFDDRLKELSVGETGHADD